MMKKKQVISNNSLPYTLATILSVLLLIVIIFYSIGYRLNGFSLTHTGSLLITTNISGTKIFIDNSKKGTLKDGDAELFVRQISPGNHTALVATENYWPWTKEVFINPKQTTEIHPFMFLRENIPQIVEIGNTDFEKALYNIYNYSLPSLYIPIKSKSENVSLWVDKNIIYAEWIGPKEKAPYYFCQSDTCDPLVTSVINPVTDIRNIGFYGDRDDVVLFSLEDGVYAIEIDRTNTQNFQPVYKGTDIRFVTKDAHTIYIKEGNTLKSLAI